MHMHVYVHMFIMALLHIDSGAKLARFLELVNSAASDAEIAALVDDAPAEPLEGLAALPGLLELSDVPHRMDRSHAVLKCD